MYLFLLSQKETSALSKALKNKAWRELYSMIRVAQPHNVPVIPKLDDFDPDTYGIIIETPEPCTCICGYIHVHACVCILIDVYKYVYSLGLLMPT